MTQTSLTGVLAEIDAIEAGAAERTEQATGQRQAAVDAAAEAERLAAAAEATARQGHAEASRRLGTVLRQLGAEVTTARHTALDAVTRGESVLDSWVRYRLTAARARGRWAALSSSYQNLTGRTPPDGPHRPELRAEPFEAFLLDALSKAEVAARRQAHQAADRELRQHRGT